MLSPISHEGLRFLLKLFLFLNYQNFVHKRTTKCRKCKPLKHWLNRIEFISFPWSKGHPFSFLNSEAITLVIPSQHFQSCSRHSMTLHSIFFHQLRIYHVERSSFRTWFSIRQLRSAPLHENYWRISLGEIRWIEVWTACCLQDLSFSTQFTKPRRRQ